MSEVQEASWADRAYVEVCDMISDELKRITGQQLREKLVPIVGEPPTPYAFGPFVARLVRNGILLTTSERVPMSGAKTHGRKTPVYQL